jgi:ferredoxin/flavodoxin---NADP+ reductase
MSTIGVERVTQVQHWNESMFSFTTTRNPGFRFETGQFVMMGLQIEQQHVMRAYSIASASHEDQLEFLSIKVQEGRLTSRLQDLQVGEEVFVSRKPTGTLVLRDLKPGKRLFLLSTGTGLAPFLGLVKDPELYERFDLIILVHGVRYVRELAYAQFLENELPRQPFLGSMVKQKLLYYPTVTREPYLHQGRLTHLIQNGRLFSDLHIDGFDPATDRAMLCGSPAMIKEVGTLLDNRGFVRSPHIGEPGDYVFERAFVER